MVSHEIPDIFYISQRIAMLNNGNLHFEGSPEDIQQSNDPVIQEFIRGLEGQYDEFIGKTGHPKMVQRFREGLAWLNRRQLPFSLVVLCLENLDEINEAAGHAVGLTVLKSLADQVQKRIRITDTCIRYGFNTLMLLLPDTSKETANRICAKLARELRGYDIIDIEPYPDFYFSVSVGFAEAKSESRLEELLEIAESTQNTFFEFSFS